MPVRRDGLLLPEADNLFHFRQAWNHQEQPPRVSGNLPPVQVHRQPSPGTRVKVQMPRIALPKSLIVSA
jgi:hypothetical protein